MTRRTEPREADIQKLITDWLSANGVWWMRMNTGAMGGSHKGKKWFVRFCKPGTADILAVWCTCITSGHINCESATERRILWIEVKTTKGVQSGEQKLFQIEVEREGMEYILARGLEDVTKILG